MWWRAKQIEPDSQTVELKRIVEIQNRSLQSLKEAADNLSKQVIRDTMKEKRDG